MTRPLNALELKVSEPLAWEWPITWRFHMLTPFGATQTELSVDCPAFAANVLGSMELGREVWSRSIAAAMSLDCELIEVDTVCWRFQPSALPMSVIGARGVQPGPVAGRPDCGCVVMMTGHDDSLGFRLLTLPGIRSAWVMNGLLTTLGFEQLLAVVRGIYMGLARDFTGAPMQWLLAYPELLAASIDNPNGVGFRKVQWLRLAHHTRPAPVPSLEPWP